MRLSQLLLVGISAIAFAAPAYAQESADAQQQNIESDSETGAADSNEIIVSARRRDERLQDVPQTVNVVTAADIEKLNLRNFVDIQSVVPGLTLTSNGSFSNQATVRGVQFTPEANGNNATVEFYLNEAPISSAFVFQSMFDIGQFELLRGPQGTLRGRASPSGSITVTTRRPNLDEAGAVLNLTYSNQRAFKGDFALNVPIVQGVLGIRLAGVYNDDEGDRVRSVRAAADPSHFPEPNSTMKGIRASATFEPTEWASFKFMYQGVQVRSRSYARVASASFVPTVPAGTPVEALIISPLDGLALGNPGGAGQDQQVYVGNIDIRFAGQKLSYVGSYNRNTIYSMGGSDPADFYGPPRFTVADRAIADQVGQAPACVDNARALMLPVSNDDFYQCTVSGAKRKSHEVRLASEERVAGIFDYVIGALYDHNDNPTRLTNELPAITTGSTLTSPVLVTPVSLRTTIRESQSTERSIFANVVAHIGSHLEVSGGLRYIHYKATSALVIPGAINFPRAEDFTATIYAGSVKYRVNDDLMFYGSIGTSWRPGAFAVGDFSVNQSPLERRLQETAPETSKSYELGMRSSFLSKRGRLNVSVFQQDFENYVYRANPGVAYINYQTATRIVPGNFNFISGVPARVRGVEVEAAFQILPRWSLSGNFAYSDGNIRNGTIPCTDFRNNATGAIGSDNIPDVNPGSPTVAQLQAAYGAENVTQCTGFNGRLLNGPKWNMSMQSEYGFEMADNVDGFLRGLLTYRPGTENDPANTNDDLDGYALVNLFAGVRHPRGNWELSAFVRNVFDTRKVTYGGSPITQNVTQGNGSVQFRRGYFSANVTPPREFGITLRAALGSR